MDIPQGMAPENFQVPIPDLFPTYSGKTSEDDDLCVHRVILSVIIKISDLEHFRIVK